MATYRSIRFGLSGEEEPPSVRPLTPAAGSRPGSLAAVPTAVVKGTEVEGLVAFLALRVSRPDLFLDEPRTR
ncbi:hypothetical protein [Rubrivirga sp. IMCC43871]|uniref:hypothetical protein n=1 Tax=Rubrivirga sp. IMCC43871 TaxID=3391575 RepID=UPI00399028A9